MQRNTLMTMSAVARKTARRLSAARARMQLGALALALAIPGVHSAYAIELLGFQAEVGPVRRGMNIITRAWGDFAPLFVLAGAVLMVVSMAKVRSGMGDGVGGVGKMVMFILAVALLVPVAK